MKLRMLIPIGIMSLSTIAAGALGLSDYLTERQLQAGMEIFSSERSLSGRVLQLVRLQKGIELDIVSTQESLTDVSATQGKDGLDDGFQLAEASATALREKVQQLKLLATELGEPAMANQIGKVETGYLAFYDAGRRMAEKYVAGGPEAGNQMMGEFDGIADVLQSEVDATDVLVDGIVETAAKNAEVNFQTMESQAYTLSMVMKALMALGLLSGAVLSYYLNRKALAPLRAIEGYMGHLAGGDYSQDVPYVTRTDEIGAIANSVSVFRANAIERNQNREQREAAREQEIAREQAIAAEKMAEDQNRQMVIGRLNEGLTELAAGNLAFRIAEPFTDAYENLRVGFNTSLETLAGSLGEIASSTSVVRNGAAEMTNATENLSKRTEQQAATIEQTAAALDEVTATVKNATERANEANSMMAATRSGAERSAIVVKDAIAAMDEIANSSNQIGQIINVIDEIAFQTNLLALNAGVEAARAGDAGKGFAVVAQEVRELAQRSASAAKEIKTLVTTSSSHVSNGVSLVNQTGTALIEIEGQVLKVTDLIGEIVTASKEQSIAISEINSSVNQMDRVTQENAAMAEQTTAACRALSDEAQSLDGVVVRFKLGHGSDANQYRQANAPRPLAPAPASGNHKSSRGHSPSPVQRLGNRIATAFSGRGNAAIDTSKDWQEF
ncbi:methyl-accepting chemotaxis protein [Peteryoungia algae]|uniref:Methyl-accepting chemotaxis protein n=1 Tax=Peteryoungia algae TaxID=2919917 RepID=A0ABT0CZE9_9HYPH|nr:methyl-accepting chemotaxis protein [Rhizobium sp. SSM4.3]MCJ8238526.1 methyl-accepting chemotaxis protein [Rhizobium sp. SSM4.3]